MRSRLTATLAWPPRSLTVALAVSSLPLIEKRDDLIVVLVLAAWAATSSTVGTIIASRRPENPIGWILCAAGFLWASNTFFGYYAIRALITHPGSLPAGEATWISA
jgi:CHASE2 domain-containing sensor protein